MNISGVRTFTELSLSNKVRQSEDERNRSLAIASQLDEVKNKYQNDQWKYAPAVSFYRNTFVENQNIDFKRRMLTI